MMAVLLILTTAGTSLFSAGPVSALRCQETEAALYNQVARGADHVPNAVTCLTLADYGKLKLMLKSGGVQSWNH